ncbi:class II glutamine amidotransferase [Thermoproteus tenax]|uniref:Predicted glutamine amidotransferase n=1 Tax=Thermoproteus tenax (strain ATCC 35583 / DSM 2078 / JCM 9277 / NBRC 100435 / Kra 1) TaxID=768679 RepID=G4RJP6_THETK|nr:glutamine amidotransferase [Thermoproteus tenax]CCC81791.1 Predicted glutamine amidotransferase [Thermoproteus tenax Kra 1]
MCRFYIYTGAPEEDLHRALLFSAHRDPLAPGGIQHKDGWGYAVYAANGSVYYYRSPLPIWRDPHAPPIGAAALAHARAASPGEPLGALYAHPFLVHTADGRALFVAHNGSVNKGVLAKMFGVDPDRYSDSWLLALFLASRWDDPLEALKEAEALTRTALNVAVLELPGPRAYAYSYTAVDGGEYYRLYLVRGDRWEAVVSSTLVRHLETPAVPLEQRKLYRLASYGF